jgi:hypothetical protein
LEARLIIDRKHIVVQRRTSPTCTVIGSLGYIDFLGSLGYTVLIFLLNHAFFHIDFESAVRYGKTGSKTEVRRKYDLIYVFESKTSSA